MAPSNPQSDFVRRAWGRGHTAGCRRFDDLYPWQCDCRAKAETAARIRDPRALVRWTDDSTQLPDRPVHLHAEDYDIAPDQVPDGMWAAIMVAWVLAVFIGLAILL